MSETSPPKPVGKSRRAMALVVSLVVCVVILFVGLWIYSYQINNPNKAPRHKPEKTARLVETVVAETGDYPAVLSAMGQVVPASQIQLSPEVSGRIVSASPNLEPGGLFKAGELIVQIDPRDYKMAQAERESEVKQAQSEIIAAKANLITAKRELAIEQGNQNIAKREFELLGEDIPESDRALVLRVPQLQAAQAAVESAQAEIASAEAALTAAQSRLDQAKLDLKRTSVKAPFNAVVVEKTADIGDLASSSTPIVTLQGTDRIWVELSVPLSDTRWIETGDKGSTPGSLIRIFDAAAWGPGVTREAHVIQVLPQVESDSRMAKVLAEVQDPLMLGPDMAMKPVLRVGSYVQAQITGPTLSGVVRLPRSMVWDGNTVRVMNDKDELEIRQIDVAFREVDHVLVTDGLTDGDRIVTTNLSTVVPGLQLRVADSSESREAAAIEESSAKPPVSERRP